MTEHPNPLKLWRYRRLHSFLAHGALLTMSAGLIVTEIVKPGTVEGLRPMLSLAYGAFCLIVLGYIANCAIESWIEHRG